MAIEEGRGTRQSAFPDGGDLWARVEQALARPRGRMVLAGLLVGVCFAVYAHRIPAPLTSDARYLSYDNADVVAPGGIGRFWTQDYFMGADTPYAYTSGYYRPLVNSLFWLEYRWAGENDVAYTVTELLVHGVNAFLVALFVAGLAGWAAGALTGLLFAIHPVNAFAATEAAARADVVFTAFYLLALIVFDRALRRDRMKPPWAALSAVALLAAFAMLSKEMALTLPAVLTLLVGLRHVTHAVPLRRLWWTLPAWAAGLGYVVWRFGVLDLTPSSMGYAEAHPTWVLALAALKTIPIHASRVLLPLQPSYPELNPHLLTFVSRPFSDPLTYLALVVVVGMMATIVAWRSVPRVAFWMAFFLVTLTPLLRVDNIGGTLDTDVLLTQERWIYLPAIAFMALVAQGFLALWERKPAGRVRPLLAVAGGAAVAALAWSASIHAGKHDDPFALLRSLYLIPEERLDRFQRANRLMLYANLVAVPTGDLDDAVARAREASALVPNSPLVSLNAARVMAATGDWEAVIDELGRWLSPSPSALVLMHETHVRVYDDLNRTAREIPLMLALANAHRGRLRDAGALLCEALRRGVPEERLRSTVTEIWDVAGEGPTPVVDWGDVEACVGWVGGLPYRVGP